MATQSNQIKINIDDEVIILSGESLKVFEEDRAAELAKYLEAEAKFHKEMSDLENAKKSAIEKLSALGLTEIEAKAIIG